MDGRMDGYSDCDKPTDQTQDKVLNCFHGTVVLVVLFRAVKWTWDLQIETVALHRGGEVSIVRHWSYNIMIR